MFQAMVVDEQGLVLFEAVWRLDLEGIVAKQKADSYAPVTVWFKVKNPDYSQAEGRATSVTDHGAEARHPLELSPPH